VVDADGTQLVVGCRVSNRVSDSTELENDMDTVDPSLGKVATVLADAGYVSETQVVRTQQKGIEVLMAIGRYEQQGRRHDFRPPKEPKPQPAGPRPHELAWVTNMRETMKTVRARDLYRKRKQTVEPVFGTIKHALGFRQFLLRGLEKVELEWKMVACAYNLKRLAVLMGR
jgi:hypothetical protein